MLPALHLILNKPIKMCPLGYASSFPFRSRQRKSSFLELLLLVPVIAFYVCDQIGEVLLPAFGSMGYRT